jgi:dihydroflavonol-4-reductase
MDALQHDTAFWSGRRVAITGATGFVGHHLALLLRGLGADVRVLARDLCRAERLMQVGAACIQGNLEDEKALAELARGAEFFFHLASSVGFQGPYEHFARVNVEGTRRALAAARTDGVARFIHTSSVAAVGATRTPQLLDETFHWNLAPMRVPYITTKRAAEELVLASGQNIVVVNPACVIGPDDHSRSEFGTLCRRFWRRRLWLYFGGGMNFVDVRDVARGLLLAARRGRRGERYLLGGVNRTWTDFFRDLALAAGQAVPRVRVPSFVAELIGWGQECFPRRKKGRPWLTLAQARVGRLFMYCTCAKARAELAYQPRRWPETLRDSYSYWDGINSVRVAA